MAENGCYGWLIWLNASKPCVGPRIVDRPVTDERDFPSLPADVYQYAGLFGQWVTVFPSQGIVVVRTGVDTGTFDGDTAWQEEMYRRILNSITDDELALPEAQARRRQRQRRRTSTAASSRPARTRASSSAAAPLRRCRPPGPPARGRR